MRVFSLSVLWIFCRKQAAMVLYLLEFLIVFLGQFCLGYTDELIAVHDIRFSYYVLVVISFQKILCNA
jgi:hypothetical protein